MVALFLSIANFECRNFDIDYKNTKGKVVVITGANSGLGFYTALELAKHQAEVILACRNVENGKLAKENIIKQYPDAHVSVIRLDLSSFDSIKSFVSEFNDQYKKLDVLINNAGIMALPQRETSVDGLEAQVGTNHYGHFLLTALLFPKISKNGRIINHSSLAHQFAAKNYPFEDLQSEVKYDPWIAYGNSKLANVLFTYDLNRRLEKSGNSKNIISIVVHPGYTATNLQQGRFPLWKFFNFLFGMPGENGALAQIYAAVDPKAVKSQKDILGPRFGIVGKPAVTASSPVSWDTKAQEILWADSLKVTKASFPF